MAISCMYQYESEPLNFDSLLVAIIATVYRELYSSNELLFIVHCIRERIWRPFNSFNFIFIWENYAIQNANEQRRRRRMRREKNVYDVKCVGKMLALHSDLALLYNQS